MHLYSCLLTEIRTGDEYKVKNSRPECPPTPPSAKKQIERDTTFYESIFKHTPLGTHHFTVITHGLTRRYLEGFGKNRATTKLKDLASNPVLFSNKLTNNDGSEGFDSARFNTSEKSTLPRGPRTTTAAQRRPTTFSVEACRPTAPSAPPRGSLHADRMSRNSTKLSPPPGPMPPSRKATAAAAAASRIPYQPENRKRRFGLRMLSLPLGDQARGAPTEIGRRLTNGLVYAGRTETTFLLDDPETLDAELVQEEPAGAKAEAEKDRPGLTIFTDGSRLDDGAAGCTVVWKNGQTWKGIKTFMGYNQDAYDA